MARQFNLFGSLEIVTDGQPSELLNSPKGCALVTYLIVTGQTYPREFLADLFWEATSTAQALGNLRGLFVRIRDLVPEFQITRTTVAFQPLPETQVDFLTLQSILDQNPVHIEAGQLDATLQLYRGDLLANFYLEDTPRFEEWLILERERLRQRVRAAYNWLCKTYRIQEQWANGYNLAERWLKLDPLDEDALRAAMYFLASGGNPGKGLQRYKKFRQHLWEEMAVDPEPATLSLATRLEELLEVQGQQFTWEHLTLSSLPGSDELSDPGPLPQNSVLPYTRNPDFTGRDANLLVLANALFTREDASTPPTAAITGMGGLGKTQLAVEFAYRYGRYFPGGVYWMRFADESNVPAEVAEMGGERGSGLFRESENLDLADRVGRVQRAWQEPVPRLLIFDNCESEELLAQWRPVTGGCRVLLTSRRGEWARELQVFAHPLQVLERKDSIALLHQLASHVDEPIANEIAEEVGDLPLALHLAGGFFNRYPQIHPNRYLDQLRDQNLLQHPSLLGRGARYSPTGHELNVERTFAVSFAQLDPTNETDSIAQQLLARAALFAPGEPIPLTLLRATMLEDKEDMVAFLLVEDALTRLITLGFINAEAHDSVIMHRLLAAFVSERIDNDDDVQRSVINALIHTLQSALDQNAYLGELPVHPSQVRFITLNGLKRANEPAIKLANLWNRHLRDIAEFEEALVSSQQTLFFSKQILGLHHPTTAESLNSVGTVYLLRGDYERALPLLKQALEVLNGHFPAEHLELTSVMNSLGAVYQFMSDFVAAQEYLEKVLDLWQQTFGSDHPRVAIALNNLGVILENLGLHEKALQHLHNALSIWQKKPGPSHPFTAHALNNIGRILIKMESYTHARPYIEQALAIREAVYKDDHPSTADSLYNLGVILLKSGAYEDAQQYLERSRIIHENVFSLEHPRTARVLIALGEIHE